MIVNNERELDQVVELCWLPPDGEWSEKAIRSFVCLPLFLRG
jgi:hypothetical protein